MHDFEKSYFGHLKNIDSVRYADLSNVDIFHYIISNNHKS